jgi:Uma2 family endonuclease
MATALETRTDREPRGERRFLLRGVGREGYETLLRMVEGTRTRLTFDGDDVELMSPLPEHDEYGRLIGWVILAVAEGLRIPCRGFGSATWRKVTGDRGLEADECFYLSSIDQVRGKRKGINLDNVPPPDLAVEVEITNSILNKLSVYASIGIPEVWRFDGERLTVLRLGPDGTYRAVPASVELPQITPDEVVRWVLDPEALEDHGAWGLRLREWVRAEVAPPREGA